MADALRAVAGPDLYRLNAFRITGLPTTADGRTVRQRRQKLMTGLSIGADTGLAVSDVDPDEVRAAFDRLLENPHRRLVDELFWLWDVPGADCPCRPSLHREHDRAAIAHGHVLGLEATAGDPRGNLLAELDQLWAEAGRHWATVLRSASTWDHLRHRIAALDDRRIDESAVDTLREELPDTLLSPAVALALAAARPARLAGYAYRWPQSAERAGDLLETAAAPFYEEVDAAAARCRAEIGAGRPEAALAAVESVIPTVERLRALLPADRSRRTAIACDLVAISLNNAANAMFERSGRTVGDRADGLLETAATLATRPETRATIASNQQGFQELVEAVAVVEQQVRMYHSMGQIGVATRMAYAFRVQVAGIPSALADIDALIAELGLAPGRRYPKNTGPHYVANDRHPGRNLAIVLLVIFAVLIVVSQCGAARP